MITTSAAFVTKSGILNCYHDMPLSKPLLPCFLLDGRCVVRVEALYDSIHAAQCAILQAYMKHLESPIGLLVNFGKQTAELRILA